MPSSVEQQWFSNSLTRLNQVYVRHVFYLHCHLHVASPCPARWFLHINSYVINPVCVLCMACDTCPQEAFRLSECSLQSKS